MLAALPPMGTNAPASERKAIAAQRAQGRGGPPKFSTDSAAMSHKEKNAINQVESGAVSCFVSVGEGHRFTRKMRRAPYLEHSNGSGQFNGSSTQREPSPQGVRCPLNSNLSGMITLFDLGPGPVAVPILSPSQYMFTPLPGFEIIGLESISRWFVDRVILPFPGLPSSLKRTQQCAIRASMENV